MGKASKIKQGRSLRGKQMNEVLRIKRLHKKGVIGNLGSPAPPLASALTGEEWLSCQTDVNKLVQPGKIEFPDEVQPGECLEETRQGLFKVNQPGSPEETKMGILEVPQTSSPEETKIGIVISQSCSKENQKGSYELLQTGSEEYQKPFVEIHQPVFPEETEKGFTEVTQPDSPELKPLLKEISVDKNTIPQVMPQPQQKWVIENQLCRCCLVEGIFDSLHSPALADNTTYDFMLLVAYNMQVFPVKSDVVTALRGVCGLCAARLRDAYAFRHQVYASEARFRDLYTRKCIAVSGVVDIELKLETPSDNDDFDYGRNTPEIPLHVEKKIKPRSQRRDRKQISQKKGQSIQETSVTAKTQKTVLKKRRKPGPKTSITAQYYTRIGDEYKCTGCDKKSQSSKNLIGHYRMVHLKIRRLYHKCVLCGLKCKTATKLKLHSLEEHNIDTRYKCGACDKIFNTNTQLKTHVNSFHMLGETIKCSLCDYQCYTPVYLKKHMDKHKSSKDFQCKYCNKSFLRSRTLVLHEKIHTGDKQKQCSKCGQAFVQKASLNYHMMKYHPGEKF